jgi:hypothetical protein
LSPAAGGRGRGGRAPRPDARSVFFYAEVTTERLNGISRLFTVDS